MSKCRSCGAEILWAHTAKGKLMPLDAEPVADGNVFVSDRDGRRVALVVGAALVESLEPGAVSVVRYQSHYATCPDAGRWRK